MKIEYFRIKNRRQLQELGKMSEVNHCVIVTPFRLKDRTKSFKFLSDNKKVSSFLSLIQETISICAETIKPGGLIYVFGLPQWLPYMAQPLHHKLEFKYWIGIKTEVKENYDYLKPEHIGLLMYYKKDKRFLINKIRIPHEYCKFCGNTLKDYGGKKHLMHKDGYAISDVWKDLKISVTDNKLPEELKQRILQLTVTRANEKVLLIEFEDIKVPGIHPIKSDGKNQITNSLKKDLLDKIYTDDCIEFMKRLPDNSIDLLFADPPYNLNKDYTGYTDHQIDDDYINWCEEWLAEYVRILKPGGALYILNLPKWAIHHAQFLSKHLYFQSWIIWDALSDPRGKLMPAHYALLYYTKGPKPKTFNYNRLDSPTVNEEFVFPPDAPFYCLRASCIRKRKLNRYDEKVELSDIWTDIHRIKHKRDRDAHPCQLPEKLLERIIKLSSNPGDIVLDCFIGTGTTAIVAYKLGRHFIGIDMDENYVKITQEKLNQLKENGCIIKKSTPRLRRRFIKKEMQLELQRLTLKLGRLPTREDIEKFSRYRVSDFESVFSTWGKALKAAKLVNPETGELKVLEFQNNAERQHQLELFQK